MARGRGDPKSSVHEGDGPMYRTFPDQREHTEAVYQDARRLVNAIRMLPDDVRYPRRLRGGRPGPYQQPVCSARLLTAVEEYLPTHHTPHGRRKAVGEAWRYVVMVERFQDLAPPVAQARVLAIEKILRGLPRAEQEARLPALLRDSMGTLRNKYRELKREQRAQPRRPYRPRVSKDAKATGAYWYKHMTELRRGLLYLREEGLLENLAEAWSVSNLAGYVAEIRDVSAELQGMVRRMEPILKRRVGLRLVQREE